VELVIDSSKSKDRVQSGGQLLSGVRIVTGVIGDDVHVVGLQILNHGLRAAGAAVTSLGVLTPPQEFVDAAVETAAHAVFVSSSNGHASLVCADLRDRFVEAGLGEVLLYLGGNLAVGGTAANWPSVEKAFLEMGFNRVFAPRSSIDTAIGMLRADLNWQEG
jgi:methylaspartate mutase sigma subunit